MPAGVCTIADSNRSIPRHLRSLMNTKQNGDSRSLMVRLLSLSRTAFFDDVFGLVKIDKKLRSREKLRSAKNERFLTSFSAARCKKVTRNIRKIREKF